MKNLSHAMISRVLVTCLIFAVVLPIAAATGGDEWLGRATASGIPGRAVHTAVWTGEEMLVWGGEGFGVSYDSGARFNARSNSWAVMSTISAPVYRSKHAAVWTGTEMVVWGGYNGVLLNSGGRYNPATDTWQPTSLTGAPSARTPTITVWTGTEVIVWGGTGIGSGLFGDGALYNPNTDTWRPMSQNGAPSARGGASGVWTGSELVIWGGHDNVNTLGDGAIYNPQTDSWRPISAVNAPSARAWILWPVWTGTEMIIWGGSTLNFSATFSNGARYNPTTDTWTTMSNAGAPAGRNRAAMVWTGKEMIVAGGATGNLSNTYINSGGRYNPATDSWSPMELSGAPSARIHHSGVWTGASMLVYGGYTGSGHGNDCVSYSPEFGFQTITGDWLVEYFGSDHRHNPAALETADADGDGATNVEEFLGNSDPRDAESFPLAGEWLQRANNTVVPGRSIYVSAWTGKEMLIWGGEGIGVSYGNGARYTPGSNTWTPMATANAPQNRSRHAGVWSGTELIVWGGYNGAYLRTGGRYNPQTDTWQATSLTGAPTARAYPAMVWTGTEVIVWGGDAGGVIYNDGAIYNPATDTWRAMNQSGAPSSRSLPAHVWTGTEMIVWGGGIVGGQRGDGAAYNPATDTWRTISSVNAPSARAWLLQSVWTGTEMIIWGGANHNLSQTFGDGARYNPSTDTWTVMSSQNAPAARNRHAMVWTGSHFFVFGGAFNNSFYVNNGGLYDPVTDSWSAVSSTGAPSARVHHHAVWNGAGVVIYGGYTGSQHSMETYSYSPYQISGLPTEWLSANFGINYRHDPRALSGADPDADGSSNTKEFQAGSNPLDALSGFASSIHLTPTLTWQSVPGVSYRILRKASTSAPQWEVVVESVLATQQVSVYLDTTANTSNGFYLIEALPNP